MKSRSIRSAANRMALALVAGVFLHGFYPPAEAAPTLTLKQAVHFAASDGSDVTVAEGTYAVDTLVGSRLRYPRLYRRGPPAGLESPT